MGAALWLWEPCLKGVVFALLLGVEPSVWQNLGTSMNLPPAAPLIHPVHPDVQMKPLPFYDVLDVLIKPSSLGLLTPSPLFACFCPIVTPVFRDSAGRIYPEPRVVGKHTLCCQFSDEVNICPL